MPDALYTRSAATAVRLLAKYGRDVVHRSYTAGTYDPATSSATPQSSDVTRKAALFDYSVGQTYVRGQMVQTGDKRMLLDASSEPNARDQFVVDSTVYSIISFIAINPAGTPVMYDAHVRT